MNDSVVGRLTSVLSTTYRLYTTVVWNCFMCLSVYINLHSMNCEHTYILCSSFIHKLLNAHTYIKYKIIAYILYVWYQILVKYTWYIAITLSVQTFCLVYTKDMCLESTPRTCDQFTYLTLKTSSYKIIWKSAEIDQKYLMFLWIMGQTLLDNYLPCTCDAGADEFEPNTISNRKGWKWPMMGKPLCLSPFTTNETKISKWSTIQVSV